MPITDDHLARVRAGEILHLRAPQEFAPLYRLLTGRLEQALAAETPLRRAPVGPPPSSQLSAASDVSVPSVPSDPSVLSPGERPEEPATGAPFPLAFAALSWERLEPALAALVKELDCTCEHYRLLTRALVANGVSDAEGLLRITLDKSLRLCLTGRHKKNYGYSSTAIAGSTWRPTASTSFSTWPTCRATETPSSTPTCSAWTFPTIPSRAASSTSRG